MTPLRQRFIQDLQCRNRSPRTIQSYVQHLTQLAAHFNISPDQLSPDQIYQYLLHLVQNKRVAWSTSNQAVCAFRFFYQVTCPREGMIAKLPHGKRVKRLPRILSREQVARLLNAIDHPIVRMLLRTCYAMGLRLGEALSLTAAHIDSDRMVLRIFGKGQKERDLPLSPVLLEELRCYWRQVRPTSTVGPYLFPGSKPNRPLHAGTVTRTLAQVVARLKLPGRITPHTLRHCYATHLLEAGTPLPVIRALLGHYRMSTTLLYAQVTPNLLARVVSPLELLPTRHG